MGEPKIYRNEKTQIEDGARGDAARQLEAL
jgi:hypothetical protein